MACIHRRKDSIRALFVDSALLRPPHAPNRDFSILRKSEITTSKGEVTGGRQTCERSENSTSS